MAGRSLNGHGLKKRVFPPSLSASGTRNYSARQTVPNGRAAADRMAGGPDRWHSWAGWAPAGVNLKLIGFATQDQVYAM